jgi:heme/copper-type cytochrome/quinol oxidase subunit 2
MRRFAAALGTGLFAEALMVFVYILLGDAQLSRWWTLFTLTQEPALHLVKWWVDVTQPGFEEQMGYIFLVPVIQWLVYAAVIYVLLWYRERLSLTNNQPGAHPG